MRIFIVMCLLFIAGCSNIEAYLFTHPITKKGDQKQEIKRLKEDPPGFVTVLTLRY